VASFQTWGFEFLEEGAILQHSEWLKRNGDWAPPEQKVEYVMLSEEDKEKDRDVVRTAVLIYRELHPKDRFFKGIGAGGDDSLTRLLMVGQEESATTEDASAAGDAEAAKGADTAVPKGGSATTERVEEKTDGNPGGA
jgi:hypothetical protein